MSECNYTESIRKHSLGKLLFGHAQNFETQHWNKVK